MGEALPTTLGPYDVLQPLGRGSGGAVHLARHRVSGEQVAIKSVVTQDERAVASLRREHDILAGLRHPAIVRVLASGLDDAPPWYAMEAINGTTLEEHVRSFWTPAAEIAAIAEDAVRRILDLAQRICSPLAYLHGEGIVHRDLKPRNVLVATDGSIVLVDFGLFWRRGGRDSRELLQVGGDAVGTMAFMAPEQWRGEQVDARADLYALGSILFVLVTGRPPFRTKKDVLDPERAAPVLSSLMGGVPPSLDDLVSRLLAKRPEDRVGYAQDASLALEKLGAPGTEPCAARSYVYGARLVGRTLALDALTERLDALATGRGGLRLLAGESGSGKTRLLTELGISASRRGMTVLTGECAPPAGGAATIAALGALRGPLAAIADRARARDVAEARRLLGDRAGILARYEPRILVPGVAVAPEPRDLPPEAFRHRLFSALEATLGEVGRTDPLMLLLDDLQWADDLSLQFLAHVAARAMPFLVIGTYRSEEASDGLRALASRGASAPLALGRLDAPAVAEIVGDMLAMRPAPAALAGAVARNSEGTRSSWRSTSGPRSRSACSRERPGSGAWARARAPRPSRCPQPSRRSSSATSSLSGDARALVEAASVLGRETTGEILRAMRVAMDATHHDATGMKPELAETLARQILEEPEPDVFRFAHDKVREVAYARIDPSIRPSLHRAAASVLGAVPGRMAEVGRHWEEGGARGPARDAYLEAARSAAESYGLLEAERLYGKALQMGDEPDRERVRAEGELASRVLKVQGRAIEARDVLRRSLSEAQALGDESLAGTCARHLGVACLSLGEIDDARTHLELALETHRRVGDATGEGMALASLADLAYHTGNLPSARQLYEDALSRREGSPSRFEGDVVASLAVIAWEQGRMDDAASLFERARALHATAVDRHREARVTGNLAGLHHHQGRIEEARILYERAATIMREIGDRRSEAIILGNLAICEKEQGRIDDARDRLGRSLAMARDVGDRRLEGRTLGNIAILDHNRGQLDRAEALYREAIDVARQVGDRGVLPVTIGNLADLYQGQGRLADADALEEQALALHREVGDRRFEGHALGKLAEIRRAQGRSREARELVDRAVAIAREVGDLQAEGHALTSIAALSREAGDLAAAGDALERAEEILGGVGEPLVLIAAACERGHLELARGHPADAALQRAEGLAGPLGLAAESEARRAIAGLALRAQEEVYLSTGDPIRQSGFGGGAERWRAEREPILDAVASSGAICDIGCANGLLAECLATWGRERGLGIEPWGIDAGARLVAAARALYPHHAERFSVADAMTWQPARRFPYVYMLHDCVPIDALARQVKRLLKVAVAPGGRLILGAYGSRSRGLAPFDLAGFLAAHGFRVAGTSQGGSPPIAAFAWIDAPPGGCAQ
ncbi:MAG: tetratricopeptide repeat protein [Acidobacteriota bacterium]